MREWVKINPDKVNTYDRYGRLLLQPATSKASPAFVAKLVDHYGADVRKRSSTGSTALHCAPSAATISVLLERGADSTAPDQLSRTPLMYYTDQNLIETKKETVERRTQRAFSRQDSKTK